MGVKKTKKNNILYTTSFSDMVGGGQWSLYYLIKHLNKEHFHPIVVCPREGEVSVNMRGVGAEVVFLNLGRIRYFSPSVIKKFISLIKEKQVALIHTDSTTETFYAGFAAGIMHIPLIWHIRVSGHEWFLDGILSLLATRLILVAGAIRQRFFWLSNSQKLVVIYNGIDLEEFDHFPTATSIRKEFDIGNDEILLACIGRLEPRKGQRYLIQAMTKVDNAKLILVGKGDREYTKKMKKDCEKFNIFDRIIFTGHRDNIPSILKEIDIVIFPTIGGEGFSRTILEAMAASKPVIATDDAGNKEAVLNGITGYIVQSRDGMALGNKINELTESKKRREQMGCSGRSRVEKMFTIERNVQEIEEQYFEILLDR
jgi:glycosyltransferase involved in cell wall biosynthesis